MTNFINNLIDEHKTLLTLLKKCKSGKLDKVTRNNYLKTVQYLLADHLNTEDIYLYPKLREMATDKNDVAVTVEEFSTGMNNIGSIVSNFFTEYEKNGDYLNSNSDLSKIILLLEVRIKKEETGLYALYDYLLQPM